MGEVCSTYGDKRERIQGFHGETHRKESLGRPRCRWDYNIKIHSTEIEWEDLTGFNWPRIRICFELLCP
jgi:hypothetical protein